MCPSNEFGAVFSPSKVEEGENGGTKNGDKEDISTGFMPVHKVVKELASLGKIVCPTVVSSLLLHSKFMVSMLFLSHLGSNALAGGTLSMAFANITCYSVIKGLAMAMEPICCQAYGAERWVVLVEVYQKMVILLLLTTIPISVLWLNMERILVWLGQDPGITSMAKVYTTFLLPDLFAQVILHPLRIFLRAQCLTTPITVASVCAMILHVPINYFLATYLNLGVEGVALASSWFTFNLNIGMLVYLGVSQTAVKPWGTAASLLRFRDWKMLLALAVPSVLSVCLEWWWYEVMLLLSGLLSNPQASVSAMGILIQITGFIYVFPHSLGMGLSNRVGHELGADQPARAKFATKIGLTIGATCGLSALSCTTLLKDCLGKLFTTDPEVLGLISVALPVLGFCEVANCPQTAACSVLTGSARPKLGAKINFVSFYLVGLPTAILMGFKMEIGFVGLWLGLVAAEVSCMCMMLCALLYTDWAEQANRAKELTYREEDGKDDLEASLLH